MLYLNKLLPIFVLPLGWVVLLLLIAILRKKRWPLIAGLAVLYLCSMPVVGNRLTYWLESSYPTLAIDQVENADAIVPLGGIFGLPVADGFLPNVGEGGERLEAGIVLWQKKKAAWLASSRTPRSRSVVQPGRGGGHVFQAGRRRPWDPRRTNPGHTRSGQHHRRGPCRARSHA